jgi:hypothetical protein
MTVTAAGFAFLLNVSDFATRRELTIASDDASAGESGEAKKPNETHKTLKPTATSNSQNGEQVPYPETTDFLGAPFSRNYRLGESALNINSRKNLPIIGRRFRRLD